MKQLTTLNDILAYQLRGMYDAEQKLGTEVPPCCSCANFIHLQKEIKKYIEQASYKIIKLERIFNYLMAEPTGHHNPIIDKMLKDINSIAASVESPRLRDVMVTSSLLAINHYKMGVYSCCQLIALEMEVETVSDLLAEIVNWERETNRALSRIALEETVYQHRLC